MKMRAIATASIVEVVHVGNQRRKDDARAAQYWMRMLLDYKNLARDTPSP